MEGATFGHRCAVGAVVMLGMLFSLRHRHRYTQTQRPPLTDTLFLFLFFSFFFFLQAMVLTDFDELGQVCKEWGIEDPELFASMQVCTSARVCLYVCVCLCVCVFVCLCVCVFV